MDPLSDSEVNSHNETDESTSQNFQSVMQSMASAIKVKRVSNDGPSATMGNGGTIEKPPLPKPNKATSPPPMRVPPPRVGTMKLNDETSRTLSTSRPLSLIVKYGSTEELDRIGQGPIKSGWFMKKAPTFKGSTKKRFLELHDKEIQYFADEREGRGVNLKGSIALDSATTKVKVAGRQLALTTSQRFWDLIAIEGDSQAKDWFDEIQQIVSEDYEVDLLPGHGDYLTKRGKGLGKHTADKRRYFTLVYVGDSNTVRLNYYVELAGLGRVPINKKGFVAIDASSQFICKDRILEVINPGYTWHLTASSAKVASRWVRILTQIVSEVKMLKRDAEVSGEMMRAPILAQATKLIQSAKCQQHLDSVVAELKEGNPPNHVDAWREEIANTFAASAFMKAIETGSLLLPEPCWFDGRRSGAKPSKRQWFEIDGVQMKCYSRPPNGTIAHNDMATASPSVSRSTMTDGVVGPSSLLPKGVVLISSDTEVLYTTGQYEFSLVCGQACDRFLSESVNVADTWAKALQETVDAFGQRSDGPAALFKTKNNATLDVMLDGDDDDDNYVVDDSDDDTMGALPVRDATTHEARQRKLSVYQVQSKHDNKNVTIVDRANVLYDYEARNDNELNLQQGQVVSLLSAERGSSWWEGVHNTNGKFECGWFPSAYVTRLHLVRAKSMLLSLHDVYASSSDDDEDDEPDDDDDDVEREEQDDDDDNVDQDTKDLLQRKKAKQALVVSEILTTERNYVRDLFAMGKGYINPMRDPQQTIFNDDHVPVLFSNVEQLLQQQTSFLAKLEDASTNQALGISECFLSHTAGFRQHSTYCGNHPRAADELERLLSSDKQVSAFFDACRMLLDDASMSVSALMLKPVQRICQYPMLWSELLKTCRPNSKEFEVTNQALDLAKEIALIINEEKRSKEEISLLFEKFDNWKGPPLTVYSCELFIQGSLRKISGVKSQNRYFFLFDNLLVITRKNVSGKFFVYATMFTQGCVCESVADGDLTFGKTKISNAFRVFNIEKSRWYVLIARSPDEKARWIEAFNQERQRREKKAMIGMNMLNMSSQEIGINHGKKSFAVKHKSISAVKHKSVSHKAAVKNRKSVARPTRLGTSPR